MQSKLSAATLIVLVAGAVARGDAVVIPSAAASTGGSGAYSTVLNSAARSYQLVVGTQHLPVLAPQTAALITGIQWRIASWQAFAAWPASAVTLQNFDITLSSSNNPAGSLSSTYTENIGPDAVLVRNGPITFGAGTFPGGAVSPAFNAWGPTVLFATPYTYRGGNLLITIRHTGSGSSNGNLDWVGGAGCQAIGVSSYTEATAWYAQGNNGAIACQLTYGVIPTNECYANCDGSTTSPVLNVLDFGCFLNKFAAGDTYANCDQSTTPPVLNVLDFGCFLNRFAAGCT